MATNKELGVDVQCFIPPQGMTRGWVKYLSHCRENGTSVYIHTHKFDEECEPECGLLKYDEEGNAIGG